MSTDIKLGKTQISKIIQSGWSFGSWLANLARKALKHVALARDKLLGLVSHLTSSGIKKIDRKITGKRAFRTGKTFTLFISNEDINEINKIMKSLGDSCVLIDGVTITVIHEIKEKQTDKFLGAFLATLGTSLVQTVISSVGKGISGRGVGRAWRGYMDKIL